MRLRLICVPPSHRRGRPLGLFDIGPSKLGWMGHRMSHSSLRSLSKWPLRVLVKTPGSLARVAYGKSLCVDANALDARYMGPAPESGSAARLRRGVGHSEEKGACWRVLARLQVGLVWVWAFRCTGLGRVTLCYEEAVGELVAGGTCVAGRTGDSGCGWVGVLYAEGGKFKCETCTLTSRATQRGRTQ